ncbi:Undecaprenyl-phosphate galactose phosphotransferase, WbaP/exopolysaccharide biosynthesis polyprenyl glycosylphosphotransferase [Deinococcus hopiensis KR-140]|uniref:Undecaprenyl-phosphate galactose phosphotransferase, WbaP/exopolysaccharide biosynthesis polyprenyl glycosylphosphotransferase n=2 Tax=Deinococcus TaxID=1298 RepID=A0A1W1VA20_9DEIO|nr:Undecaprenyl-phosphate galactose phosphotransferase, WbaP/exopolysaccharide biosynthesis polyprenyl glycosylphosphotransferase [Deinococcus hopiensis KR-140]
MRLSSERVATRAGRAQVALNFQISFALQVLALLIGDLASVLLAYGVSSLIVKTIGGPSLRLEAVITWMALWISWRAYQGLYPGYGRSPQTELRLHTVGTTLIALTQLAASFAAHSFPLSARSVIIEWLAVLFVGLFVRYFIRNILIRSGNYGRPVSIIGAGSTASLIITHLKRHPAYGLNPVAAYDDNVVLHGSMLCEIPVLGSIELALTQPATQHALISIPSARSEVQQRLINSIYAAFPITWVIPDLFNVPNQALQFHNIGTVASLELKNNLRSIRSRLVKRSLDLIGSTLGLIILLPILVLIALAIKIDSPGPVVYRARRLGRYGKTFDCFKFRSMHRNAEEKLQRMLDNDPSLKEEFDSTHKLKNDPRVTRVGRFLRKTSLDELPQLINVIIGNMSLVGPRPIVEAEVSRYKSVYEVYKQVQPGMTGYWQANGRSDTTYDERVDMDKFYITNWTVWLDLIILLQTVRVVLMGRGAY